MSTIVYLQGTLPCFPTFFIELEIPKFPYILDCLLFCNIIMTGEHTHTASKERMAPEVMFLLECAPQHSVENITSSFLLMHYAWIHQSQYYKLQKRKQTSAYKE